MGKADLLSLGKNVSAIREKTSSGASRLASFYRRAVTVATLSAVACGGHNKPSDNDMDSGKPDAGEMDSGKGNPCDDLTLDDLPKGLGLKVLSGNTGKMTVSGGAYDGFSVDIPSDAVDHDGDTAIWMREVTGLNVPNGLNRLPQIEGLDYALVDADKPFIDDGVQCAPNIVELRKGLDKENGPDIFAPKVYADMLFCDPDEGECEQGSDNAAFNSYLTEKGTHLKTGHFSTFFPLDSQPVVKSEGGNNLVVLNLNEAGHLTFDLSRVTDERSHIGELLELDVDGRSFVRVAGSPDQWISADKFEAGNYKLKAQVKGANNITSGFAPDVSETLTFNFTVDGQDPCEDLACDNGTCSMGECVCDDGYEPSADKKSCKEVQVDPCENVDCDDSNACTTEECVDGQCVTTDEVTCADNGNVCDGAEMCDPQSGECESVGALTCDLPDTVAPDCAAPICVTETGCDVELSADGTPCEDGTGKCMDGQCEDNECNSDADCNSDGNMCAVGTCNDDNECEYESVDENDNDECTIDMCDPETGVSNTPLDCDDSNLCTTDGCDSGSGCTHMAVNPDDGNACTVDSCDPVTGVSNVPVNVNDNDGCTIDSCSGGTISHNPVSCGTGSQCVSTGPNTYSCETIPAPTANVSLNAGGYGQGGSGSVTISSSNATSCSTSLSGASWVSAPGSATSGTYSFNNVSGTPGVSSVNTSTTCTGPGGTANDSDSAPIF